MKKIEDISIIEFEMPVLGSKMYCMIKNEEAIIVDPCLNDNMMSVLSKVKRARVILTHEHIDHISGVSLVRNIVADCEVICSRKCAERIIDPRKSLAKYLDAMFCMRNVKDQEIIKRLNLCDYACSADIYFENEYSFSWQGMDIKCVEMPGHSTGSIGIIIDNKLFFSGDSLLKNVHVTTSLPGGSKKDYRSITVPLIKALPNETLVYPGHGESFILGENEFA